MDGFPDGECGGDLDDGEPVFGSSFPAGGDASPVAQPAVGAFDRPAFAAEWVGWPGAASVRAAHGRCSRRSLLSGPEPLADHRFDSALSELTTQLGAVIAAVCPELGWREAAREQLVNQREQVQPLVLVARTDPDRKRCAGSVDC